MILLMMESNYPKDAQNYEEDNFKEMPVAVVSDLEQYQLSTAIGIHDLR